MSERIGLLDYVSVQTKPTRIPFVCYEEILMCLFVLEYATKEQIFLCEKQTHIHQSSLNPPDRATTISRLIT